MFTPFFMTKTDAEESPIEYQEKEIYRPQEIIIKQAELNINKGNTVLSHNPKPMNLDEFVGQSANKQSIRTTIKIIQQIKPVNIFIHGYPGCGKSTLAEIISNELDANFIYTIPEQLKNLEKVTEIINNIQENKKLTVWMVDECHTIDKKFVNILLPILQDHRLGDVIIREFVMIMATTDYNKLYKKSEALISRFQTKIYLEKYTIEEIVLILKQYNSKMNLKIIIPEEDFLFIANNSKGIPREAINLLLKRYVTHNVNEVLQENKIVRNGINESDIKILNVLNQVKSPIGANFLSQRASMLESDYLYIYEPFLVEKGFIDRTKSGRMITESGKKFLKELKNE